MATIESLHADIAAIAKELKSLSKIVRKVRAAQEDPNGEKAKTRAENNGFNRKLEVSPELLAFLGLAPGELVSRSNVTKGISVYVTDNGLKHPDNGRVIIMDEKLTKLLNPPPNTQITFLNIQKFLKPHYATAAAPAQAPAAVKTEEAAAAPVAVKTEKPKRPVVAAASPVTTTKSLKPK
jgi:chromatin remodeling complex protein RSC6